MLDRPEVPLHTNGSERDLRPQVIKRKISGGTRSDPGRACRDAFLGLLLTCAKLGVSFWDYLGHRLGVPEHRRALPARPRQAPLSSRLSARAFAPRTFIGPGGDAPASQATLIAAASASAPLRKFVIGPFLLVPTP